jgi:excisionase family DNA binding protein
MLDRYSHRHIALAFSGGAQVSAANKTWISISEAARRLGTSHHVINRLVNAGLLSVLRLPGGCHPRVSAADLDTLIEQHTRSKQEIPAA